MFVVQSRVLGVQAVRDPEWAMVERAANRWARQVLGHREWSAFCVGPPFFHVLQAIGQVLHPVSGLLFSFALAHLQWQLRLLRAEEGVVRRQSSSWLVRLQLVNGFEQHVREFVQRQHPVIACAE